MNTGEISVQWTPADEARAQAILAAWANHPPSPGPVVSTKDLALVSVQLMLDAERILMLQALRLELARATPGVTPDDFQKVVTGVFQVQSAGDKTELADSLGVGAPYRAAAEAVRMIWREYRVVTPPSWYQPPPEVPAIPAIPMPGGNTETFAPAVWIPFAIRVVGIAAAAITTYYVVDRVCQIYDGTAVATAVLHARLQELQFRMANGLPMPPPPEPITTDSFINKLADQSKSSSLWLGGAAVLALAAGGAGLYYGMKHPRMLSSRRSSPSVRERVRMRSNPSRRKRRGRLESARARYRRAHPAGAFPKKIETPAERKGHRKAARKVRRKVRRRPVAVKPKVAATPKVRRKVRRRPAAAKKVVRKAPRKTKRRAKKK